MEKELGRQLIQAEAGAGYGLCSMTVPYSSYSLGGAYFRTDNEAEDLLSTAQNML